MKKNIYRTTAVVTGLSVAERSLGFLYRIVLSRLIGSEGLGLYQVALSVFSVFITLGTGGIPITVSRLISKSKASNDPKGESAAVTAGMLGSLLLTIPVCLIFLIGGNKFSFLFSDERCLSLFYILLIGLVFSSVYAVIRGSFWGNKQFLAPSVLELVEETVMVIAGVLLLRNVTSVYQGAKLATYAVIISYFVSFTSSIACFFIRGGRLASPKKQLKPLFSAAMPITAVRAGGSLIGSAVAVLLPAMLIRAGATKTEALQMFGVVSGMAIPVLSIPSTIIGSISLVLVPELSEDFYRKRFKQLAANIERGLSATVIVACALIPLFFVLGEDVGRVMYSDADALFHAAADEPDHDLHGHPKLAELRKTDARLLFHRRRADAGLRTVFAEIHRRVRVSRGNGTQLYRLRRVKPRFPLPKMSALQGTHTQMPHRVRADAAHLPSGALPRGGSE